MLGPSSGGFLSPAGGTWGRAGGAAAEHAPASQGCSLRVSAKAGPRYSLQLGLVLPTGFCSFLVPELKYTEAQTFSQEVTFACCIAGPMCPAAFCSPIPLVLAHGRLGSMRHLQPSARCFHAQTQEHGVWLAEIRWRGPGESYYDFLILCNCAH